ncbi:hypothetical protein CWI75_13570 [Kineobactrum sediminis]|uniref:DUF1302 domain-containing protein n=1 Tax=Kineobactrum sediminis TaxID=1905677 RepID=A0A2N5Y045_9GAMM|nr:DUF1302 family protein [Kineobactrum sediminis]PLW81772.1 hypothetical protein CWI75_13570 [Kineobactrum sediminis]
MVAFSKTRLLKIGLPVGLLVSGTTHAAGALFDPDVFGASYGGFVRFESAIRTTSDENPFNQAGNPFNNIDVQRNPIGGTPDTVRRPMPIRDNDFNMNIMRGKFDIDLRLGTKLSFRGEVRAIFDFDTYKHHDINSIPGADPAGALHQDVSYFDYRVSGQGGLQSRKAPMSLEWTGEKYMIDLPRFYFDYQDGALLVRAGNQQIAWGQSLFFRVMDVPNGLDLRRHSVLDFVPEEFSDKRVPSPAVRVQYMFGGWEMDGFVQHFRPTIYGNPDTPYNTIASQFTIHDLYGDYDDKANFGIRVRGDVGPVTVQAMATNRYNPDGTFRWTESGVSKSLTGLPGDPTADLMATTAFERDSTGVLSAREWFHYAGLARLDGIEGLNASIAEFPGAQALGAYLVDNEFDAGQELDLFFSSAGGLRGHLAREYHRESVFGLGLGYTFNGEPGSFLDQLIANLEIQYANDRTFTNPSLSREHIVEDEIITSLVLEKYHRFSREFPATYFVFQWMHRTESDIFGRHLSGMGGTADRAAQNARTPDSANYVAVAIQQPSPTLKWRFDFSMLYDTEGAMLLQPAVRWRPGGDWGVEAFFNHIIEDGFTSRTENYNALSTAGWADEFTLRVSYSF